MARFIVKGLGRDSGPILIKLKGKRKGKKGSKHLRPAEKAMRRLSDGAAAYYAEVAERHRDANRKSKDGWLKKGGTIHRKALKKAQKKAKVPRRFRA